MNTSKSLHVAAGMAALGICESLLIAMTDLKILRIEDVRNLLTDVAETHQETGDASSSPELHYAVVKIIDRILVGKNGMRIPGLFLARSHLPFSAQMARTQATYHSAGRRLSRTTSGTGARGRWRDCHSQLVVLQKQQRKRRTTCTWSPALIWISAAPHPTRYDVINGVVSVIFTASDFLPRADYPYARFVATSVHESIPIFPDVTAIPRRVCKRRPCLLALRTQDRGLRLRESRL